MIMSPSHQESIKLYSVSSIEEAGKHRVRYMYTCIYICIFKASSLVLSSVPWDYTYFLSIMDCEGYIMLLSLHA